MAIPLPNSRLPGTRSTETVADSSQLDFLRALWTPIARALTPTVSGDTVAADELRLPSGLLTVCYVRHPRARRYRLLFRRDGSARCTLPRRGTIAEARRFVTTNEAWLDERLRRHLASPRGPQVLRPGGAIWLHGVETVLEVEPAESAGPAGHVRARLGDVTFGFAATDGDLRPLAEQALRRYAAGFLSARTRELAALHGLTERLRQVSVRNQRTRWGSCSPRGLVCLNWRLVQTPPLVRDYVILHELAHLRHLNHSARFWAEVERLCPGYAEAEKWLKQSGRLVL